MEKELQRIYDSEINVRIQSFWDGGFRVAVGDEMNGLHWPKWDSCEIKDIIPALQDLIREHYPQSAYARDWLCHCVGEDFAPNGKWHYENCRYCPKNDPEQPNKPRNSNAEGGTPPKLNKGVK